MKKASEAASIRSGIRQIEVCGGRHDTHPGPHGGTGEAWIVDYRNSAHGDAVLNKGLNVAPSCATCHGEHTIQGPQGPDSPVAPLAVPATCGKCHGDKASMSNMGVPSDRVSTFMESYHGIALLRGDVKAANCASCHWKQGFKKALPSGRVLELFVDPDALRLSAHKDKHCVDCHSDLGEVPHSSLPASDPRSSVSAAIIPKTCGKCHPGANANFAKGRIHINAKDKSAGIVYWVALGFKILTLSTLAGLFVHIGLDLLSWAGPARRSSCTEKFDYWAVYWGMVVRITSGYILWFKDQTINAFGKFAFDIGREASYEKTLAAFEQAKRDLMVFLDAGTQTAPGASTPTPFGERKK